MVLVETSVWIEGFRRARPLDLVSVVEFDEIVTCLPIVQEVLQGFRAQRAKRVAEFREAFDRLKRTEPFNGGFRWYFQADSAQEALLRQLAQCEHECCRFFEFTITREGASVVWETRAPDEAAAVLDAFRRFPETLEASPEHDAPKNAFIEAGLQFVEAAQEASSVFRRLR